MRDQKDQPGMKLPTILLLFVIEMIDSMTVENLCDKRKSLKIDDNYCLPIIYNIDNRCWLSQQCSIGLMASPVRPVSSTVDPDTLVGCYSNNISNYRLSTIDHQLYQKFDAEKNRTLIPGICRCHDMTFIYNGKEGICKKRLNYSTCTVECLRRPFSTCNDGQCACITGTFYGTADDQCVHYDRGLFSRKQCTDNSCDISSHMIFIHSFANILGFSFSMVMIFIVWMVIWNCQRNRAYLSESANVTSSSHHNNRIINHLRYSDLRGTIDTTLIFQDESEEQIDLNNQCSLPSYQDTEPPSYEEAVIKSCKTSNLESQTN